MLGETVISERVDIVLATYNGGRYLSQQLDSLLAQKSITPQVLVSDDGSTDQTLDILAKYQKQFAGRIEFLRSGETGKGACANFDFLLGCASADYVFLSDQDDVWDQDKVTVCMAEMKALEAEFGCATPLLVHSDLRVVDQRLNLISPSFFRLQNLSKRSPALKDLLCQNVVTGCTVVANRALLEKALPIPRAAGMHDWWLGLVAAAFGKIGFVDRATISYRQHDANTIGAKAWSIGFVFEKIQQLMRPRAAGALLLPSLLQARSFFVEYGDTLDKKQVKTIAAYANIIEATRADRLRAAIRHGFSKQGVLRSVGFYWALLIADFYD